MVVVSNMAQVEQKLENYPLRLLQFLQMPFESEELVNHVTDLLVDSMSPTGV